MCLLISGPQGKNNQASRDQNSQITQQALTLKQTETIALLLSEEQGELPEECLPRQNPRTATSKHSSPSIIQSVIFFH